MFSCHKAPVGGQQGFIHLLFVLKGVHENASLSSPAVMSQLLSAPLQCSITHIIFIFNGIRELLPVGSLFPTSLSDVYSQIIILKVFPEKNRGRL
jgi:hypothetical protein